MKLLSFNFPKKESYVAGNMYMVFEMAWHKCRISHVELSQIDFFSNFIQQVKIKTDN